MVQGCGYGGRSAGTDLNRHDVARGVYTITVNCSEHYFGSNIKTTRPLGTRFTP